MAFDPLVQSNISLVGLAQLSKGEPWRLALAHDRDYHLLVWVTRGQGLALLDGAQRGIGAHNALFIPARHLMAFDLGRQCFGQALLIPHETTLALPATPQHLRVLAAADQAEMNQLTEALGRELNSRRPLGNSAALAYCDLVSIWLRRQMLQVTHPTSHDSAARRLSRRWCAYLVTEFTNSTSMITHAATLGVTPTHLARVCKVETGKTAAALLVERQLHAARQLLCDTNVAILEIARHLGFASAAGFTRFTKSHIGQSPSLVRRNARKRE